jgi:signal transduction histidine kinase
LAAVLMLLGVFVSKIASAYLLKPLKTLTNDVLATEPGVSMERLSRNYRDSEFEQISEAFNRFLSAMEALVDREKSFVKLASHEFRTPLAVILGALDVLEQRKTLSEADYKTLGRIRKATRTMREDTEMLLRIARGELSRSDSTRIDIVSTIRDIVVDIKDLNPAFNARTTLNHESDHTIVQSDPALVRMVIRNLLQNALEHTDASVGISVTNDKSLRIQDFGKGLEKPAMESIAIVKVAETRGLHQKSFGLLIVQLACDRLNWKFQVEKSDAEGTVFLIQMQDLAD